MKNLLLFPLFSAGLLFSASTLAAPITLNFNNTAPTNTFNEYTGTGYTESGFSLQAGANTKLFTFDPGWDTAVDNTDFFDFEPTTASAASMTLSYASPFSLLTFDANNTYGGVPAGSTLSLVGNVHGGGTLNANLSTLANGAWQNFSLNWTNLDSVVFTTATDFVGLDNIALVTTGSTSSVPVPGTVWLLLSGFAGFVITKTKRTRA